MLRHYKRPRLACQPISLNLARRAVSGDPPGSDGAVVAAVRLHAGDGAHHAGRGLLAGELGDHLRPPVAVEIDEVHVVALAAGEARRHRWPPSGGERALATAEEEEDGSHAVDGDD